MSQKGSPKRKLTKSEHAKMMTPFEVTSVCRMDLVHPEVGYSPSKALKITDAQMKKIASKLADDYCEQLFWGSLQLIAEFVLRK